MVAAGLGLEPAGASRRGCAVGSDEVAELRLRPLEFAGLAGVIPFVLPFAVDEKTHHHILLLIRM